MKILWDGTGISETTTGMSNYCLNLINHIVRIYPNNDYNIILKPDFHTYRLLPKNINIFPVRIPNLGSIKESLIREVKYLRLRNIIKQNFDIYHCLTGNWPFFIKKGICTFHDLRFFILPESYYGLSLFKNLYLNILFRTAVKSCDKIIAISNSTKDNIIKFSRTNMLDIKVIYHGIKKVTNREKNPHILSKFGINQPYILFVGELKKHKNIVGLIKAFNLFKKYYDKQNAQLVIVGKKHEGFQKIIKNIPLFSDTISAIKITNYLNNEELELIYDKASVFSLLSFVEGFGLPILEAMNHNIPIVCSNIHSLTEVAGDAAIKVDPKNYNQIARAFSQILDNQQLCKELINKGKERVNSFRWEKAANLTFQVYEEICK